MALLDILHYPDPRLHLKAIKIEKIDSYIHQLIADMADTMYHNNGIGLAATQVNIQKRLFIVDLGERNNEARNLQVFINLEILEKYGKVIREEGCLSVPSIYEKIQRAEKITVRYQDIQGKKIENTFDGLMAICIQHENDHLDGKIFLEHLSNLKQTFIKKKLKNIQAEQKVK